jgi:hypothetical protein
MEDSTAEGAGSRRWLGRSPAVVMAARLALAALAIAIGGAGLAKPAAVGCDTAGTPFCSSTVAPPPSWRGRLFKLSQAYPKAAAADAAPWLRFDPKVQHRQYMEAVLAYFYDGNLRGSVDDSFEPDLNTKRRWYEAPWLDQGTNGREPLHGLTRERVSKPGELAVGQQQLWDNYAIGFYNAAAAGTIGRMWADHGSPDASKGVMPEGAVGAKLLFTTATEHAVRFLKGAPTWRAYVYANPHLPDTPTLADCPAAPGDPDGGPACPRKVLELRLLQIDIAVKDKRSPTGWVFGTFIYGGGRGPQHGAAARSGWTNVEPVGLMWGNDPDHLAGPIVESWLNKPAVQMHHYGFNGRLNGPVDNPLSSCLSCHSTAQTPFELTRLVPPTPADAPYWFRNVPSGTPFDEGRTSLDYSLQLAMGLNNYQQATAEAAAPPGSALRHCLHRYNGAVDALPARGADSQQEASQMVRMSMAVASLARCEAQAR